MNGDCSPIHTRVDAGCVQENFIHIDVEKTFQKLNDFFQISNQTLKEESRWLQENHIDLIISDAASLPLKAGHALGVPSLLIGNFTWHDIYSYFPGAEKWRGILDSIQEEYAQASLQILPQCHIVTDTVANRQEVGFIARRGKMIRNRLQPLTGLPLEDKTVVFIYLGENGASSLQWKNLEKLKHVVFLTRDPLPDNLENLWVLDDRFSYPDLIASSDVVLTKAGYSTLATAFSHGIPVLSCTRPHFREFEAMREYLNQKQVGLILEPQKFFACDWGEAIEQAESISVAGKVSLGGEEEVLAAIDQFMGI